jgi:hypothetical protein
VKGRSLAHRQVSCPLVFPPARAANHPTSGARNNVPRSGQVHSCQHDASHEILKIFVNYFCFIEADLLSWP